MGNSVAYTVEMPTIPATSTLPKEPMPTNLWTTATSYHHQPVTTPLNRKNRIAFASCNDQDNQNNLWPIIQAREPAAFVWGGDAIYAGTFHASADFTSARSTRNLTNSGIASDTQGELDWSVFPPAHRHECATPDRLREFYEKQRNIPGYKQLMDSNITIFGTFDGK
jgi:hypothetical protein